MKTKLAAGVLTLATAIPAFALSGVIWPDPPGAPVPPPWLGSLMLGGLGGYWIKGMADPGCPAGEAVEGLTC